MTLRLIRLATSIYLSFYIATAASCRIACLSSLQPLARTRTRRTRLADGPGGSHLRASDHGRSYLASTRRLPRFFLAYTRPISLGGQQDFAKRQARMARGAIRTSRSDRGPLRTRRGTREYNLALGERRARRSSNVGCSPTLPAARVSTSATSRSVPVSLILTRSRPSGANRDAASRRSIKTAGQAAVN